MAAVGSILKALAPMHNKPETIRANVRIAADQLKRSGTRLAERKVFGSFEKGRRFALFQTDTLESCPEGLQSQYSIQKSAGIRPWDCGDFCGDPQ
jgi:hypothetical protein